MALIRCGCVASTCRDIYSLVGSIICCHALGQASEISAVCCCNYNWSNNRNTTAVNGMGATKDQTNRLLIGHRRRFSIECKLGRCIFVSLHLSLSLLFEFVFQLKRICYRRQLILHIFNADNRNNKRQQQQQEHEACCSCLEAVKLSPISIQIFQPYTISHIHNQTQNPLQALTSAAPVPDCCNNALLTCQISITNCWQWP